MNQLIVKSLILSSWKTKQGGLSCQFSIRASPCFLLCLLQNHRGLITFVKWSGLALLEETVQLQLRAGFIHMFCVAV